MLPKRSTFKPYSLIELNFCLESQSLSGILQGLKRDLEASKICEVGSYLLQLVSGKISSEAWGALAFHVSPDLLLHHPNILHEPQASPKSWPETGRIKAVQHYGSSPALSQLVKHTMQITCLLYFFWVRPSVKLQTLLQRLPHQEHTDSPHISQAWRRFI